MDLNYSNHKKLLSISVIKIQWKFDTRMVSTNLLMKMMKMMKMMKIRQNVLIKTQLI